MSGPETWKFDHPGARGSKQSPIDIATEKAVVDELLKSTPLKMNYEPRAAQRLINTGSSIQVTYSGDDGLSEFVAFFAMNFESSQLGKACSMFPCWMG